MQGGDGNGCYAIPCGWTKVHAILNDKDRASMSGVQLTVKQGDMILHVMMMTIGTIAVDRISQTGRDASDEVKMDRWEEGVM